MHRSSIKSSSTDRLSTDRFFGDVTTHSYRSRSCFVIGLCVAVLFAPLLTVNAQQHRRNSEESWYTKYPAYPPYCATPSEMATRKVPVLAKDSGLGETRLLHVTAVLRHGARTPYAAGLNCWEGYDTNPDTAVWDCNLTSYMAPPPSKRVNEEEDANTVDENEFMFLFEKTYDALLHPENNLSNFLHGTCQLGQMLVQGYEQELINGKYIREAYAYDENKFDHDARMRLLDITPGKDGSHVWDKIYYRADDDIRTLMSGQVVLRGFMAPELDNYLQKTNSYPVIPLHTADRARDVLDPNHQICPRLSEIYERNQQSTGFQAFTQSKEAHELRDFQKNVLKVQRPNQDMDAIDCLMTTMCTDRTLPDAVNDYSQLHGGANRSLAEESKGRGYFQRLVDFDTQMYVLNAKANDAEYSRLSLGPLWYEIMENINPHIGKGGRKDVQLAIFSGHDTTIIPMLAALAPELWPDTEWPSYASMVLLEIHEVNIDGNTNKHIFHSNYAFRLIYNGQVWTNKIEACPDDLELCDLEILLKRVSQFAHLDANCQRLHERPVSYENAVSRTEDIMSTTEGIVSFLCLVLGSAAIGATIMYFYINRGHGLRRRRRRRDHQPISSDPEIDGIFNGTARPYSDAETRVNEDDEIL